MAEKRKRSKSQLRNLAQYKDLSEEDFETIWQDREITVVSDEEFNARIDHKIQEFAQDYDLDDLKINDKMTLRAFVQAVLALEDYEKIIYEIRNTSGVSAGNINVSERVNKVLSDLRRDISRLQEDLNISRKNRKSDKESSVVNYISNLKEQARLFYESKMSYIFCPECNMLLATVWTLYPENDNKIILKCGRKLDDGSTCTYRVTVTTKELMQNKGTNKPSITPESML